MQKIVNPKLKWVERVSYLMDEQFRLPGTNFKFGLDPLINLIPGVGDLAGFAVSSALVLSMARHGVSRKVLILMALNVALDSTIGAIPIIGQIFDFAYKSNSRNIRLLKEHYEEGKHQGSGKWIVLTIMIVLILFFILFLYVLWQIIEWVIGLF
jgi:hypothetical protein